MIGILNAYHFDLTPGNYQENYMPMMLTYLNQVMPQRTYKVFNVAQGDFPSDVWECNGYIITGSPASCYDNEPWIHRLIEQIKEIHSKKVPLLGICFGHQMIAYTLGGCVKKSKDGWGIGNRTFTIRQKEKWMHTSIENNNCSLLFSHQDQVTLLPDNAKHLASDTFCKFQIYSIENHIFCIQGHPEFTTQYAKSRYISRQDSIGQVIVENAINSLSKPTSNKMVGQWINSFFNHGA
jgi:GMP synthase-like glutamine amidotransferase